MSKYYYCCDCGKEISRGSKRCASCSSSFKKTKGVPTPQRFWDRIDKNGPIVPYVGTPCWTWTGTISNGRYGTFGANRRSYFAHRFSYELHHGEIPKGMQVCHKCDNPSCVNPDHLFLGTQSDNIRDMYKKNRYTEKIPRKDYVPKGERHPNAKLTKDDIIEIRKLKNSGVSQKEIAKQFGVAETNITSIVHYRTWKNI